MLAFRAAFIGKGSREPINLSTAIKIYTEIYTSELILCFTIWVHSATRHNIHMYHYNKYSIELDCAARIVEVFMYFACGLVHKS